MALRPRTDEQLVERVRAGDDAAFSELYDRHHRGLLAFCRHMLGQQADAEDVLQHTYIAAYRQIREGERELQLKAWLYAVARNRCLSVLRARREGVALDDVQVATEGLPSEVQRRADLQELLADLQGLPDDQRAALVLAELGDLSHDEVAEVLGVRREKVKALVFQARERLWQRREARTADCAEIREQLATLTGAALRRAPLRAHLEVCDGCRAFRDEVRRQRAAMAAVLPVVPSAGLKATVLAAIFGGGGGGAALLGGGAAGSAGVFVAAKGALTKLLVVGAVAGTAGTAGYVGTEAIDGDGRSDAAPAPAEAQPAAGDRRATPPPAPVTTPAVAPAAADEGSRSARGKERSAGAPAGDRERVAERRAPQADERAAGPKQGDGPAGDRGPEAKGPKPGKGPRAVPPGHSPEKAARKEAKQQAKAERKAAQGQAKAQRKAAQEQRQAAREQAKGERQAAKEQQRAEPEAAQPPADAPAKGKAPKLVLPSRGEDADGEPDG